MRMKIKQNIVAFIFLLPLLVLIAQDKCEKIEMPEKGICAHRGAMETHPENTIPAFQEAIRLGAHMIEFDVRLSKDGHLVIIHDSSIDRTTNGTGKVNSKSLEELKELDCGNWKSEKFKGTKIPTLEEVLNIMPNNIWLNIHLKGGEELGKATAMTLNSSGRIHQGVIACGSDAARGVKSVNKNIMICNMERHGNRTDYVQETIDGKFSFLQLLKKRNDNNLLRDAESLKKNNVKVNYYFGDTEEDVRELFKMGVDFVLTNRLEEMLEVAKSIGIKPQNYKN